MASVLDMTPLTAAMIDADMREWLGDCYESERDFIAEADTSRIVQVVSTDWDGGLEGFCLAHYGRRWEGHALAIIHAEMR